jgi:glycosyltransferase involved in cell wall biosynthesis
VSPQPVVSVVIPAYNQAAYLRGAIDSVLAQDEVRLELIVVNDGSTDDTAAVLQSYNARLTAISQPNQGAANALNRGIRAARAELICWLSADDEFLPGKISAQVAFLARHPDVAMCCTGFVVIDGVDRVIRHERSPRWPHPDPFLAVFWRNPINGSTVMLRRSVYDDVGPFDERLAADVDADMWMRIATRWEIGQIAEEYVRYRVHGASLSANRPAMRATMTEVRRMRIDDGSLIQRVEAAGEDGAALLARMSTEYAWRGLRGLARDLLGLSLGAGRAPRWQMSARLMLAATAWTPAHLAVVRLGGRLRRGAWRLREAWAATR